MHEILSGSAKRSKTSDIDVNMFIEVLGASPCFACIRPKNELEFGFCEEFEAQNYFQSEAGLKQDAPEVFFSGSLAPELNFRKNPSRTC